MQSVSSQMDALLLEREGSPLKSLRLPTPVPGEEQVLVRVLASGVNPLDIKIARGAAPHARHPLPAVLGIDLAGEVAALGDKVRGFQVGDEVFGMTGGVGGHQGSLAEYVAADARLLAHTPNNLSMRQAAALPLAFITAWEGLVDRARVAGGQTVLVHGGAGGVGHVAIQVAQSLGATVFATGRAAHLSYIASLGATPVDHEACTVEDYVAEHTGGSGFDVVYDTVGGPVLDASFKAIRHFGHVVSALGWGTHALAPLSFRGGTYSGVFTLMPLLNGIGRERHGEILRRARDLADRGLLVPRLDPHLFDLGSANEAHQLVAAGRNEGKVVIDIGNARE
jgi:NADPH2:quinone reductase